LSEKCNAFLRPLKNKGFKEERMTRMRLGNLSTSTTLESNKSLVGYLCTLFPTLFLRALAMYAAFPRSDYYAPFDCL
jgi:hypothetical protein